MSTHTLPAINQKKMIFDFLRDRKSNAHESIANTDIEQNGEITKPQKYYINQSGLNSADKDLTLQSSSQINSQNQTPFYENIKHYHLLDSIKNDPVVMVKQSFIKLKSSKHNSNPNYNFTPFINERDSLGNLLKDDEMKRKDSFQWFTYKKLASINMSPLPEGKIQKKNRILPESTHAFPTLSTEPDQNAQKRRNENEQSELFSNKKNKYSNFVIKINHQDQNQQNLEESKVQNSIDKSYQEQQFAFKNFTYTNRVQKQYPKNKSISNEKELSDIFTNQKDYKIIQRNMQPNSSNKIHLKITNTQQYQSHPSVGIYNPNYQLVQRNTQTHRIQPLIDSKKSKEKLNQIEYNHSIKNMLSQQQVIKKAKESNQDDNYEKLFNKMMREIKKKVEYEQQVNQGNLLHPDGDQEIKKVASEEEMEHITGQYKKNMFNMKNILNKIRNQLNIRQGHVIS